MPTTATEITRINFWRALRLSRVSCFDICSTRRPAQATSTEDMHVDVKNRLPGLGTVIKDKAKLLNAFFLRHLIADSYQLTHELFILFGHSGRPADMLFRNNKKMHRRCGRDVPKSQYLIILIEFVRGDITLNDLTEQTVFSHSLLLF
ncbi:hypothetical protein H206_05569 [Candidatus Electrothrix aarhusensis]|uniref:Uncharacterized protein n=1 Tax=Candidatus Electrothrix aarhusensis TaxID=1859131 RepID=A0A444J449_9BACT|nr:hypothetical protein H206_05569 [Candidatus Electrothrix aarhusensis]